MMRINETVTSSIVVGICCGIGAIAFGIFLNERSKAKEQIIALRSDEDKELVCAAKEAKEAYDALKTSEAVKEVPVVIDINKVDGKLNPISARAARAVNNLKSMNDGIVSDSTLKNAFENIADTEEVVQKIIGEARNKAVIDARTEGDWSIINEYKELVVKEQELYAKERGLVPGYFGCMGAFLRDHRDKIPYPLAHVFMITPIFPVFYFCTWYIRRSCSIIACAYKTDLSIT